MVGVVGVELGFTGTKKVVTDKVLYPAGEIGRWTRPRLPQPRFYWTDAAFELSFKLTLAMLLYIGVPTMGGIVGNVNLSTILLMAVGVVID